MKVFNDFVKCSDFLQRNPNYDSELKARLDLTKGQLDIMTAQVEYLKGQIVIKDQQLDKQAFSLQSVIQENSRKPPSKLPAHS